MKKETPFELIIFLYNDYTLKELLALGYKQSTLSRFINNYYPKALKKFKHSKGLHV